MGIISNGPSTDTMPSQVQEHMNNLDMQVAEITELVKRLHSRLITVLRPEPPTAQASQTEQLPHAPLVSLAQDIRSIAARLYDSRSTIQSILERLEL